jgi:dUTP pyrophosphatase
VDSQKSLIIRIRKLRPEAQIPKYSHLGETGDLGADLYAVETTHLPSQGTTPISTGIALQLPQGFGAIIEDPSGLAIKGLTTLGGVIDPGFRGEIMANLSQEQVTVNKGERVAQLRLVRLLQAEFEEVQELSLSERRERGFVSTGK